MEKLSASTQSAVLQDQNCFKRYIHNIQIVDTNSDTVFPREICKKMLTIFLLYTIVGRKEGELSDFAGRSMEAEIEKQMLFQ